MQESKRWRFARRETRQGSAAKRNAPTSEVEASVARRGCEPQSTLTTCVGCEPSRQPRNAPCGMLSHGADSVTSPEYALGL